MSKKTDKYIIAANKNSCFLFDEIDMPDCFVCGVTTFLVCGRLITPFTP